VVPTRPGCAPDHPGSSTACRTPALDPFRGYANAVRDELDDAVAVLDAFHVVLLDPAPVVVDYLGPGLDDEKSGAKVALVTAEPPQGCHEMVRRLGRVLARVGQAGSNVASRACSAAWSGPTNGGVCGASSTVS
jgi:hypothetical protein